MWSWLSAVSGRLVHALAEVTDSALQLARTLGMMLARPLQSLGLPPPPADDAPRSVTELEQPTHRQPGSQALVPVGAATTNGTASGH